MGMAAHGVVAYGYHLGGDDGSAYEIVGGHDDPPWYDHEQGDLPEQAMLRMLVAAGLATEEQAAERYWPGRHEAEKELGVDFESTGSLVGDGYVGHMLVAKESAVQADWGEALPLDVAEMNNPSRLAEWDERLAWALNVLGLAPTQAGPRWLLGAIWG